jgi:hypothetical protein
MGVMQGIWLTLNVVMLVDLATHGTDKNCAEPMFLCIIAAYINALLACMGRFEGMCAVHTMSLNTKVPFVDSLR